MSICVVVRWLSGLSEDARLFWARGGSISALLERARAHCRRVKINHSKTNHILWFIWAPIRPRCSAATSRDQRLNQQPVRGIWGCWQRARAHREGPIMKPDPPFLQPTPQRLHWQTSHWTQLHMTHISSSQIHFMTLLLRDTFLCNDSPSPTTRMFISHHRNTFHPWMWRVLIMLHLGKIWDCCLCPPVFSSDHMGNYINPDSAQWGVCLLFSLRRRTTQAWLASLLLLRLSAGRQWVCVCVCACICVCMYRRWGRKY